MHLEMPSVSQGEDTVANGESIKIEGVEPIELSCDGVGEIGWVVSGKTLLIALL